MSNFQNSVVETINHVSLPTEVTKECVKEFDRLTNAWISLPVQLHVLDFKEVHRLHVSFFATAIKFRKQIESARGKMVSMNVPQQILDQMRAAGVDTAMAYLKSVTTLKSAKTKDSAEEVKKWVAQYSIEAARKALATMFQTSLIADENFKDPIRSLQLQRFTHVSEITSIGPVVKASFRLYFEKSVLENLVRSSLPNEPIIGNDLLESTATEILNLTFSAAKSKLNDDRGYQMPGGIPKLVSVAQASQGHLVNGRPLRVIPFTTPLGCFYLEIENH